MRLFLPALALLLVAVACGGGGDDPKPTRGPTPSPTAVAAGQPTNAPTPGVQVTAPPARVTPRPTPGPPSPDAPLYIALGDSLSYGVSASDRFITAFVPLVHASLPAGTGLLNLGHSGDDSEEIMRHGHLDQAIGEIVNRNGDGDPGNDVVLLTLEIGGNDLLDLFFDYVVPGRCPTLVESLQRQECIDILDTTLTNFEPNLKQIMDRLQAADPDLNIVLMTLYNPFSNKIDAFDPFGVLSLEGMPDTPFPEGMNDIIRAQASAGGVRLADVYPLFVGKAPEYISQDIIHPNDTGYSVMADAVIAVLQ
jgi:lysophospholipase L1-like esterase